MSDLASTKALARVLHRDNQTELKHFMRALHTQELDDMIELVDRMYRAVHIEKSRLPRQG